MTLLQVWRRFVLTRCTLRKIVILCNSDASAIALHRDCLTPCCAVQDLAALYASVPFQWKLVGHCLVCMPASPCLLSRSRDSKSMLKGVHALRSSALALNVALRHLALQIISSWFTTHKDKFLLNYWVRFQIFNARHRHHARLGALLTSDGLRWIEGSHRGSKLPGMR